MSNSESELPVAQPVVPSLDDRIQRLESAVASLLHADENRNSKPVPLATAVPAIASNLKPRLQRMRWLLFDLYREAVAIFRMFVDIRYHVAWSTRVLTVILFLIILTSHLWMPFPYFFGIGPVMDKLFDLLLAFVMYKVLSREAARYLEMQNSP